MRTTRCTHLKFHAHPPAYQFQQAGKKKRKRRGSKLTEEFRSWLDSAVGRVKKKRGLRLRCPRHSSQLV